MWLLINLVAITEQVSAEIQSDANRIFSLPKYSPDNSKLSPKATLSYTTILFKVKLQFSI